MHGSDMNRLFVLPRLFSLALFSLPLALISHSAFSRPRATALCPQTAPVAAATGVVSMGTYNVENFWDDISDNSVPYEDFGAETSNWYADEMYLSKAKNVAQAIALAGTPDILVLQEIESADNNSRSLEFLKSEVSELGYKFFALGQQNPNDPTAVTTAVISKYPIVSNNRLNFANSQRSSRQELNTLSSARDPQVVTIDVMGTLVRVYASHWKSRLGDFASGDAMRFAIARLIKTDIDDVRAANPELDIVVMGDFNSNQTERPLLLGLQNSSSIEEVKNIASFQTYNLWFELSENERCSYVFKGQRECLDHILVSPAAFDGKGLDLVEGSFRVVGHSGEAESILLGPNGNPVRWQKRKKAGFNTHTGKGYSDHLPLVADFSLVGGLAQTAPSNCKKNTPGRP